MPLKDLYGLWRHLSRAEKSYNVDSGILDDKDDKVDEKTLPAGDTTVWCQVGLDTQSMDILSFIESYLVEGQTATVINNGVFMDEAILNGWASKLTGKVNVVQCAVQMRGCEDDIVIYFHSLGFLNELITRARRRLVIITSKG